MKWKIKIKLFWFVPSKQDPDDSRSHSAHNFMFCSTHNDKCTQTVKQNIIQPENSVHQAVTERTAESLQNMKPPQQKQLNSQNTALRLRLLDITD